MIEELFRALEESGTGAGPEELADILWLAARIGGTGVPAARDLPDACDGPEPPPLPEEPAADPAGAGSGPAEEFYSAADVADAPRPAQPGVDLVRVRRAASLRDPLAVMRALRPLGRGTGVPYDDSGDLDEELTVRRTVEQGLPTPVLRRRRGRWLDLALVVDAHHSMLLWHDLVAELRRVFVQTGIFRDVRVWHLHGTDPATEETLSVSRTPGGAPRSVHEVSDPSGHRLVLVVTDTVAAGWAGPGIGHMLRQWSAHGPVAVLNVLPRRLWDRGAVRPRPLLVRSVGPAAPNVSWRLGPAERHRRRSRRHAPAAGIAIPVVEAGAASVSVLAELVAGNGQWTRVPCLTIPRTPEAPPPQAPEPLDAATDGVGEALRRFRTGASPTAQRLAGYLSAVPLNLPVMNLVRQIMLPGSEHGHLAEVALGGLFAPWEQDAREGRTDPDKVPFRFRAGVKEALLGGQRRDAITAVQELVRREMGAGVSERGAGSGGDFLAGRGAGQEGGGRALVAGAVPFAERVGAGGSAEVAGPQWRGVAELAGTVAGTYIERDVDEHLRNVMARAEQGLSSCVLVVGEPGSGKTTAIRRAVATLPPDWTWWEPRDADALMRGAAQVGPRSVVLLDEFSSFALASVDMARLLMGPIEGAERGPVVVLGEIRSDDMDFLLADDSEEALTFQYLRGRIDVVPISTVTESATERRLSEAPSLVRSMLRAALDIRRLGHGPGLSRRLLEAATAVYHSNDRWEHLAPDWLSAALDYACESIGGGPGLMVQMRGRPARYRLSDYGEWRDRQEVPHIDPPDDLWPVLARLADRDSLLELARSAQERGLDEAARHLESSYAFLNVSPEASALIRRLIRRAEQRLVRIWSGTTELGSGVLLSDRGQVVMPTLPHPIPRHEPLRVQVRPWDAQSTLPAEVVAAGAHLTVLATTQRLPGLPWVTPPPPVPAPTAEEPVLVVGFGKDSDLRSDVVVLRCRVTATDGHDDLLEPTISAPWPAEGAAVVDLRGTVIGVVSSIDESDNSVLASRLPSLPQTVSTRDEQSPPSGLLDPHRSRAVLIGADRYEQFPALPGTKAPAVSLAAVLGRRQEKEIFDGANVSVFWNPQSHEALDTVSRSARDAQHTLLVYYSGHVLETADDAFLAFFDTNRDNPRTTALSIRALQTVLNDSPALYKVLVLDGYVNDAERIWSWLTSGTTPHGTWSLLAPRQGLRRFPHAFTNDLAAQLTSGAVGGPEFLSLDDIVIATRRRRRGRASVALHQQHRPDSPALLLANPAFAPPPSSDRYQEGTVMWFNEARGYGFIATDDGPDIFVHYSAIDMQGRRSLEEGQRVRFHVRQGQKGPQAASVRPIGAER